MKRGINKEQKEHMLERKKCTYQIGKRGTYKGAHSKVEGTLIGGEKGACLNLNKKQWSIMNQPKLLALQC